MLDPTSPTIIEASRIVYTFSDDWTHTAPSTLLFGGFGDPSHVFTTSKAKAPAATAEVPARTAKLASHFECGFFKAAPKVSATASSSSEAAFRSAPPVPAPILLGSELEVSAGYEDIEADGDAKLAYPSED